MAITRTVTQVYAGPSAAGQILVPTINVGLGVPASMPATYNTGGVFGGDSTSGTTTYCGYRHEAAMNLSGNQYVGFLAAHNDLSRTALQTWANGGLRIVFQDGSGNWASFHFFSSGLYNDFSQGPEGGFVGYLGFGSGTDRGQQAPAWVIDRSRTPDQSSGVLNWTNITAFEVHFRPRSSGRMQIAVGRFMTFSVPRHTGSVTANGFYIDIRQAYGAPGTGNWPLLWMARDTSPYASAGAQIVNSLLLGVDIGDGATATNLALSNQAIVLWPRPEDASSTVAVPNATVLVSTPRLLRFNQSATDVVALTDMSISTTSKWGLEVTGNVAGTCIFTRCQFWRYESFVAGHGQYIECQFNGASTPVAVTTATVITRGLVRDATSGGLQITSGPGIYSALDVDFSSNTTFDVAMGSGGAGTYELTNVGVVGAYTLKIHNDSATNAITVAIPAGIAYTTSTAGGSITVSTPATYQSVTVNGLVSGSRLQIYDTTSNTELSNVITGTSYTWTDPNPAVSSRDIRVRIAYFSGVTAKQFIEANIGTTGTSGSNAAVTYLANQVDDAVYIANGIDGSTVTGITITDSIDRMILNIAGGSISWSQIYAYNVYWLTTSAGVIDDGAIITAVDTANYEVTGFKIRNSSTTPLSITGGYGRDAATGSVSSLIDTAGSTGNIYQTPDHVVAYATGSGLSPAENAKLMSLNTDAVNLVSIKGQTINGTGSDVDPWGP